MHLAASTTARELRPERWFGGLARRNEATLVREDDELRSIACVQLGEDPRDVRLRRQRADHETLGDLGVVQTACDERQDLDLARRQRLRQHERRSSVRVVLARDVCLDQAPRRTGLEQRLPARDSAYRVDELRGIDSLEQEPAGTGAE